MDAASPPHREKENYVYERHGQKVEDSLKSVSFCFGRRFNIVECFTSVAKWAQRASIPLEGLK